MMTVGVRSGEGFSHEQQLNNSVFVHTSAEKLECFNLVPLVSAGRRLFRIRAYAQMRLLSLSPCACFHSVISQSADLLIAVGLGRSRQF